MAMLSRTFHMERSAALMARYASAVSLEANLAHFFESTPGDGWNPFRGVHGSCVAKFDLWSPNGTSNMNPVIISRSLQRLTRYNRSVKLLLSLLVGVCGLASLLNLQPLPFSILVRQLLFVMGEFWLLDHFLLCMFNWAQNTLVILSSVSKKELTLLSALTGNLRWTLGGSCR